MNEKLEYLRKILVQGSVAFLRGQTQPLTIGNWQEGDMVEFAWFANGEMKTGKAHALTLEPKDYPSRRLEGNMWRAEKP